MESKIIELLTGQQDPVPTIAIAKYCCGNVGTKKSVNPTLYRMEREGVLVKTAKENGADPRWSLVDNITVSGVATD